MTRPWTTVKLDKVEIEQCGRNPDKLEMAICLSFSGDLMAEVAMDALYLAGKLVNVDYMFDSEKPNRLIIRTRVDRDQIQAAYEQAKGWAEWLQANVMWVNALACEIEILRSKIQRLEEQLKGGSHAD